MPPSVASGPRLTVLPDELILSPTDARRQSQGWRVSSPAGRGALTEVSSIESKGDMVIDSRLANERDGWAGSGGHPWHLDEQTESIMFLTNMGEKPARIGFDVVALGTHYYLTKLKLQPHETQAINLRKLRDAQKEDFKGNKIPAAATDGSVIWSRLDHVPVMGRLLVLQRHKGISSNYDCHICDCPADFVDLMIDPASMDLMVNEWLMSDSYAKHQEHCNGYNWWDYAPADYSSADPPIATATTDGLVTGRSGGSTTITATYTDYYYTYSSQLQDCVEHPRTRPASGPVNVQKPTFLKIVTSTTTTTCSGSSCLLELWFQVLDVNGNPINKAGMQITESVTGSEIGTCTGSLQDYGTWTTDGTGKMTGPDYWWWCCSPQGCNATYTFNQRFTVNGYTVQIINGSYVGSHNVVTIQCNNGTGSCPTVVPTP